MGEKLKILILGNAGSGKSWLGEKLASALDVQHLEMDHIFWEPGGYNKKRDKEEVHKESERISKMDNWIVEGVFGEIADLIIESATHLIWLDFDWNYCLQNLNNRGPSFKDCSDKGAAKNSFEELIEWASKYDSRESKASKWYHSKLFQSFDGVKWHISDLENMNGLVTTFTPI